MNKNNTKYPLPVGKRFKYRNQEYVVAQHEDFFGCTACEEANAQYIKDNPYKCVALTKTGKDKFNCNYRLSYPNYPKRIK
jgi:hypothetical protein